MTLENIISKIKEQLKDGIYPGASLALYQLASGMNSTLV